MRTLQQKLVRMMVVSFLLVGAGCSVIGYVDDVTAGRAEREKKLNERLTKFHRELYWGGGNSYVEYLEISKRQEIARQLRQEQELEKLVDLEVRGIEFHEDNADVADVDVKVRFYKKSSLSVTERFEKETWEFYPLRGGWFLRGREIAPTAPLG